MAKEVKVQSTVARILSAESLDIVTERLQGPSFDLVIATNILPYFDDLELMLAMSNVAAMLGPGGVFMHNEPRPLLGEVTDALGLRFEQARQATIATVRGAPPLADSVWIHKKNLTAVRNSRFAVRNLWFTIRDLRCCDLRAASREPDSQ